MNEKRCPKCHRFGVDTTGFYPPIKRLGKWRYPCIWNDCGKYSTLEEIENAKHPDQFKKFRDAITQKDSLA